MVEFPSSNPASISFDNRSGVGNVPATNNSQIGGVNTPTGEHAVTHGEVGRPISSVVQAALQRSTTISERANTIGNDIRANHGEQDTHIANLIVILEQIKGQINNIKKEIEKIAEKKDKKANDFISKIELSEQNRGLVVLEEKLVGLLRSLK